MAARGVMNRLVTQLILRMYKWNHEIKQLGFFAVRWFWHTCLQSYINIFTGDVEPRNIRNKNY